MQQVQQLVDKPSVAAEHAVVAVGDGETRNAFGVNSAIRPSLLMS